ncbi:MAG: homocysteine S-methyltransferase family protein [Pseudomonas veronii]|nr:homocysteine S-methyltransferase family protein [Pseudomonas veronii]
MNIVGGCCGTTPDHIAAIAEGRTGIAPRHPETSKRSCACPAWNRSTSAPSRCS